MEYKFSIGKFPPRKPGLPFQKFRLFRKISSGTNQKVMFHLHPKRNFRKFSVSGKRPEFWLVGTRDYQAKMENPSYRPYSQGYPSLVIFRHRTLFFRECYSMSGQPQ